MDDDEFGGFEAAESFDIGDGEPKTVSPAIPWAAFPSGVHIPKAASPDGLLDLSDSSTCLLSSDVFSSSGDNTLTVPQDGDVTVIHATPPEQQNSSIPLDAMPVYPLNVKEKSSLEKCADVVRDAEPQGNIEPTAPLQEIISSLDMKLQDAEKEKVRIKKELQDLMEQQSVSAMEFLKEKENEDIAHGTRYSKLQVLLYSCPLESSSSIGKLNAAICARSSSEELEEQHKNELEDMRKAGHEALAIIVEEFKALLKSSVQQQGEASERQYQAAIEKQSQKCEELLKTQHQRLLDMLDKEEERFEQKMNDAFAQQLQDHKGALETCLAEERQRSQDALEAAVKIEQDAIKDVILKAVEDERRRLEIAHSKEKEAWQEERKKDQETISQAIEEALCVERKTCQGFSKELLFRAEAVESKYLMSHHYEDTLPIEPTPSDTIAVNHLQNVSGSTQSVKIRNMRDTCLATRSNKTTKDLVKAALAGEQKKSEMAVQEAVRQTREEMMEYIKEQKRLDQVARQRSLSSLELFLACAQKQLASLIGERPVGEEEEKN